MLNGLLTHHILISQAHAVSRQHTSHRMHQDARHTQCISHQARVLSTCTAKALQGVACHVIATGHRDFFNGVGHLLHRNVHKPFGNGFCWSLHIFSQGIELLLYRFSVEGLIGLGTKHMRKVMGLNFPEQHVCVSHG